MENPFHTKNLSTAKPEKHPRVQVRLATVILTSLILSIASPVHANDECVCKCDCSDPQAQQGQQSQPTPSPSQTQWTPPQAQNEYNLIITAYYSPQPNQTHYALGSYEADVRFNGEGYHGSDGTNVYAGMLAAPSNIPFGTIIEIPNLEIVGTVHDRGGRIIDHENGTMRIDIWMGRGEDGLARALQFGTRYGKGIFHFPQPNTLVENVDFDQFEAPQTAFDHLPTNPTALLDVADPKYGDTSPQVAALQVTLQKLGYFDHDITGYYGAVTKDALRDFQWDIRMDKHGELADKGTRHALIAHRLLAENLLEPLPEESLALGINGKPTRVAQRILRLLKEYDGEIDGMYNDNMMQVVYKFQKNRGIVDKISDTGAGVLGPRTRTALLSNWRDYRIGKRGGAEKVARSQNLDNLLVIR